MLPAGRCPANKVLVAGFLSGGRLQLWRAFKARATEAPTSKARAAPAGCPPTVPWPLGEPLLPVAAILWSRQLSVRQKSSTTYRLLQLESTEPSYITAPCSPF